MFAPVSNRVGLLYGGSSMEEATIKESQAMKRRLPKKVSCSDFFLSSYTQENYLSLRPETRSHFPS